MNKTAIKNFAVWARVQLIESVKQRAFEYDVTENGENKPAVETAGGRLLSNEEKEQRRQLIEQIRQKGYTQVMEEAAYTWFNRFIALRFMEINGYLPSRVRVFTDENGEFKPEILKQAMTVELEGMDKNKVLDLLDKQDNDELYKYLLITQCNALNTGLPYMFEKISNWTELLFPANLLRSDSVLGRMISDIPEEDWTDAVQIIGWLYQYYNSELKDETFALLSKNVKITKERIPAATQLFTPDWIVRYMVENSLGRLWYEGHPDFDKSPWKYYLDEAEQDPEVEAQLEKIRSEYALIKPEDIRVIDPCMGSGHILVYAFDVLMQIYTSVGWSERDAAKSILENNLYGLDIDDRAGQLAYFAVMMKARKYSRRILNGDVAPNVLSIQESNWMTDEFIAYVAGKDMTMKADLVMLRKTFRDAKEYGSILNVPTMQYNALYKRIDVISRSYAEDLFQVQYRTTATEYLLPLVRQLQIMSQKYDVVVTNPPYMGSSSMSSSLSEYTKKYYPDSKSDLFAVFIEKCAVLIGKNRYQAMITQHAWMFLSSFEKLRVKLQNIDVINMAHLGARAFEDIGGEVVQTTTFVMRNSHLEEYAGTYCRLVEATTQQGKEDTFLSGENRYFVTQNLFKSIPSYSLAYWASEPLLNAFRFGIPLGKISQPKQGMVTRDNARFMRMWWEPAFIKLGFNVSSHIEAEKCNSKWFPCTNGGPYRKWYGNNCAVVNYEHDGEEIIAFSGSHIKNREFYFLESISWSAISSSQLSMRYAPNGFLPEHAGNCLYCSSEKLFVLQGLANSCVGMCALEILSPTLNFNVGDIADIPVIYPERCIEDEIIELVKKAICLSKADWDSYETSWGYMKHPLI